MSSSTTDSPKATVEQMRIVLLANHDHRVGPDSRLIRFIREFRTFLTGNELLVSPAVRRSVERCNLALGKNCQILEQGRNGGLVALTTRVIKGRAEARDKIDVVIYLIDPRDPTSLFPETSALKRECVIHDVLFLSTYRSAVEWASLVFSRMAPADFLIDSPAPALAEQRIALIAHDRLKTKILKFALLDHRDLISNFKQVIATGVTGEYLRRESPLETLRQNCYRVLSDERSDSKAGRDLLADIETLNRIDALEIKLSAKKVSGGPDGGDIEIANQVLGGKLAVGAPEADSQIDKVLFFEDPFIARAHEVDIQVLERACRLAGESVVSLSGPFAADIWASAWKIDGTGKYREREPMTVSSGIEYSFGRRGTGKILRAILTESSSSADVRTIMRDICHCGASYVNALVNWMWDEVKHQKTPVNIALGWGSIMNSILDELEGIVTTNELHPHLRSTARITAMPLRGMIPNDMPNTQGLSLARRLAKIYRSDNEAYERQPPIAWVKKGEQSSFPETAQLRTADIVLLSGTPVEIGLERIRKAGNLSNLPAGVISAIEDVAKRGAVAEVCGMFIDADGKEVDLSGFEGIGLKLEDLVRIGSDTNKRIVLFVGGNAAWDRVAIPMLRGTIPLSLVSDQKFVRHVLDSDPKAKRSIAS